jgi:hypothetical protein
VKRNEDMKKTLRFFLMLFVIFLARPVNPSQVRVDSAGGLDLVMTDEAAEVNPYIFGNPAGLVLLPTQIRSEFSAPWWYTTTSETGIYDTWNYGVSAASPFQGFLAVSKGHWAFQAGGAYNVLDTKWPLTDYQQNFQNGLGLVRGAGALGPFSLGAEFRLGAGSSETVLSGNQFGVNSTAGLLANIPLAEGDHPAWLRLGGSTLFDIEPERSEYSNEIFTALVKDIYTRSASIWKPCLFLEFTGSFQGGILAEFSGSSTTNAIDSSDPSVFPDIPAYTSEKDDRFYLDALYKWKITFSPPGDPHPLSFNHGIRLEITEDNLKNIGPAGDAYFSSQVSEKSYQLGLGLEREKDFTAGFQASRYEISSVGKSIIYPGSSWIYHAFSVIRISLGGEKYVSPQWALRLGLMYEDSTNPSIDGSWQFESEGYYAVDPGHEIWGIRASAGAGYQGDIFKADARIFFEQPQCQGKGWVFPEYDITLFGAEISVSLLLGS